MRQRQRTKLRAFIVHLSGGEPEDVQSVIAHLSKKRRLRVIVGDERSLMMSIEIRSTVRGIRRFYRNIPRNISAAHEEKQPEKC